jgi:hypothetical protein
MLVDASTNTVACSGGQQGYGLDLHDVAECLFEPQSTDDETD